MGAKADEISRLLTAKNSLFDFTTNFVCVPNVSWGLLPWEADLIVCSKAGYLTEVEVKISASDWHADRKKRKWKHADIAWSEITKSWELIKDFWYAAPMPLAERWEEFGIPDWAGVIGVDPSKDFHSQLRIFRSAKSRKTATKMDHAGKANLARLGCMRLWPTENKKEHPSAD